MVSDDMIKALVQQAQQTFAQAQMQALQQQAPRLRLNQNGVLEVADPFDEPDTHDEWRSMNAGLDPG